MAGFVVGFADSLAGDVPRVVLHVKKDRVAVGGLLSPVAARARLGARSLPLSIRFAGFCEEGV